MKPEPQFLIHSETKEIIQQICGEPSLPDGFRKMAANTSEGAAEKHLPVVEQTANQITVKVGSVFHPMSEDHSIAWIYLQTHRGGQIVYLTPDDEPVAHFALADGDRALAAYAYCNLHGFWKTEL